MAATFDLIATTTLASPASSVTFSSIGSSYTTLMLTWVARSNDLGPSALQARINGSSGAQYSQHREYVTQTGVSADNGTGENAQNLNTVPGTGDGGTWYMEAPQDWGTGRWYLTHTQGASWYRNGDELGYAPFSYAFRQGTTWQNTGAITSLTFYNNVASGSYSFMTGSRFSLYGMVRA